MTTTFFEQKSPQFKFAPATIANLVDLMNGITIKNIKMTSLATQYPEKSKKSYHKKSHQGWTKKKDLFQKYKVQNQKLSTPMNLQHYQNVLKTQKTVAVFFKDVKTEETSVAKARS